MKKENKKEKIIQWYDNSNIITTIAIAILFLIIVLSQSYAVQNNLGTNDILRSLLNHNSIYLLGLVYFIPLKTLSGKKYFNYLNLFLTCVYAIFTITGILTIIQSFGIISLVTLGINLILLVYMVHTLYKSTRVWTEFKLKSSPLNEIGNSNYFYSIVVLSIVLLTINLIDTSTIAGAVISLLGCLYNIVIARYIYLYKQYVDSDDKSNISLFGEVDKVKKSLPKMKQLAGEVSSHNLNNYQIIAVVTFGIAFCVGIIFGNLFPSCGTTSNIYSTGCSSTEFNFSLTLTIWFISFLICVLFYGLGHIISLLESINNNLMKKK